MSDYHPFEKKNLGPPLTCNKSYIFYIILLYSVKSERGRKLMSFFRETLEEVFKYFVKTCQILEGIINECLGLPPNLLKEYNDDRSLNFMVTMPYPPATDSENNGIFGHEDGNLITIVLQEDVGGLEVYKDGDWIPVIPAQGTLVVNLSDVIQVHIISYAN